MFLFSLRVQLASSCLCVNIRAVPSGRLDVRLVASGSEGGVGVEMITINKGLAGVIHDFIKQGGNGIKVAEVASFVQESYMDPTER